MRKGVGVACIVIGVLLLVKAHDIGGSFASRIKETFEGVPVEASLHLYLAGTIFGLLGLLLIFWKRR
jgi:hypothetical protein